MRKRISNAEEHAPTADDGAPRQQSQAASKWEIKVKRIGHHLLDFVIQGWGNVASFSKTEWVGWIIYREQREREQHAKIDAYRLRCECVTGIRESKGENSFDKAILQSKPELRDSSSVVGKRSLSLVLWIAAIVCAPQWRRGRHGGLHPTATRASYGVELYRSQERAHRREERRGEEDTPHAQRTQHLNRRLLPPLSRRFALDGNRSDAWNKVQRRLACSPHSGISGRPTYQFISERHFTE